MKGIDIFCASQAATATRLSMEEGSSSSSSSTIQLGSGRAIDRYNPIIRDPRRLGRSVPSCSSQPSIVSTPRPLNPHGKNTKNLSNSKTKNELKKKKKSTAKSTTDEKRKSSADDSITTTRKGWSCTKPGDFISPPGSSRYLLSDQAFLNVKSDFDPVLKLVPVEPSKTQVVLRKDESCPQKPSSSSRSPDQVVVLRVSLHCRGCERKMRKHISRMEGVSSFNIDFAAKKVTVVGNVTPLGVLNSISKVKNAQLWTPSMPPTIVTPVHQNNSEMKNSTRAVSNGPNLL